MALGILTVALVAFAATAAGLQQRPADLDFYPAPREQAVVVGSEAELLAALATAGLNWADGRVVQLRRDIQLSSTLVINGPVRLQGACGGEAGEGRLRRCSLCSASGAAGVPLVHISGPAAVVEFEHLELSGGVGAGSLAGGLTASNHSLVDLVGVRLAGNAAASGGALRADAHATLRLVGCEVEGNTAEQAGGGAYVHSASLHLDRTTLTGNTAPEGAGIALAGGSRATALHSRLGGNRLTSAAAAAAAGVDVLLVDGGNSAAYAEPLPEAEAVSVRGGELRRLSLLTEDPEASGAPQLHKLWEKPGVAAAAEQQQQQGQQQQQRGQQQPPVLGQPTEIETKQNELSEDERVVTEWMLRVAGRGSGAAAGQQQQEQASGQQQQQEQASGQQQQQQQEDQQQQEMSAQRSRKLKQQPAVKAVTNEKELAEALMDKERFIRLDSHIGLTGAFQSKEATLPPIKASLTITGNCKEPIFNGKCLIDAKGISRIFHADNSGFFPSFFVTFENIQFTGGVAPVLGGAFWNQGKMQVEFRNCEFIDNLAQSGAGAVSLQDGAIGLFNNVTFQNNMAVGGNGAGGAVYLTSNAGFTSCRFQNNAAPSGGAVGVGQSSSGIYFNGCTFSGNKAEVFGNDIYMESWVATPAYFNPYPTSASVYPESTVTVQPYTAFVSWPAYPMLTSPPPSPPRPPRPPPPSPPSPPNPANYIYTEDQLWNALAAGNSSVTLGAHIQMTRGGRWWQGPPPTIIFPMTIDSQCKGFGSKCLIDLNGAPNPLFIITTNALFSASNLRILNGATMGSGAAVQITGIVKLASFDSCDFMGNLATDGGAVNVLGSSNVRFSNCQFGVNTADNMGGAVKTVGSNVTFSKTSFFQNRAGTGGAIGMGPMSNVALLTTNFSDNLATKATIGDGRWGDDIFIAAPAGSSLALNKLPPESVAKIFPKSSNTLLYTNPPPAPAPLALLPSPPFMRPPFPAPTPQPPMRQRSPPPSPPSPPPRPPPSPPGPPLAPFVKSVPIMWGPMIMTGFLLVVLVGLCVLVCCHKRVLPRLEKPGELAKRLRGEYEPSDSEEEEMSVGAGPSASEIEVAMEGYYGTARFRRKAPAGGGAAPGGGAAAGGPLGAGAGAAGAQVEAAL